MIRLNITCAALVAGAMGSAATAWAGVNQLTPLGPEGGRIMDVAFHPTSPDVLYLAASSGFYRSTDGGSSWRLTMGAFRDYPADIAVDPNDGERVYVAAWDQLFVSADGGQTFTQAFLPNRQGQLLRIECAPSGAVYVSDGAKMYVSRDRGGAWEQRGAFPEAHDFVYAIALDPSDANVMYVALYGRGVFVSGDGGASWQAPSAHPDLRQILQLKIDRLNPQRLWAGTTTGVFRSDDAGASWAQTLTSYSEDVELDPGNSQVIYAARSSNGLVQRSDDAGATWRELTQHFGNGAVTRVVMDAARPQRMAAFAADGLWLSTDGGAHWLRGNTGLVATGIRRIVSARDSLGLYIGTTNSGVHWLDEGNRPRAVDNARLGIVSAPFNIDIVDLAVAQGAAPDTLIAILAGSHLARSTDGGFRWTRLDRPSPSAVLYRLALTRGAAPVLYVGGNEGLFSSTDLGNSWTPRNVGLPPGAQVASIALSSNPQVLYIGVTDSSGAARLFRTNDGAQSWTSIPGALSVLAVHPDDEQLVFGAANSAELSHLMRSIDGGATWTQVSGDGNSDHYNDVAFDPRDANVVYASANQRVLRSTDRGATWERLATMNNFFSFSTAVAADPAEPNAVLVGSNAFGLRQLAIRPDVQLTVTAPASMAPGAAGAFTVRVVNQGAYRARDVRVSIQAPSSATQIAATAPEGSCAVNAPQVVCTFAALAADASASINLSAIFPTAGTFSLQASAAATEADSNVSNNSASANIAVAAPPPPSRSGGGGGGAFSVFVLLICADAARRRRLAAR